MEKTKETSNRKQALAWWKPLNYQIKYDIANKYLASEELGTVDPLMLTDREIEEIWKKESISTPKELREVIDKYVFNKPNKKQFIEFNEDLFKAYIAKLSNLGKRKAIEMLLKNCDFQKAELIKDDFNLKLQITKF